MGVQLTHVDVIYDIIEPLALKNAIVASKFACPEDLESFILVQTWADTDINLGGSLWCAEDASRPVGSMTMRMMVSHAID